MSIFSSATHLVTSSCLLCTGGLDQELTVHTVLGASSLPLCRDCYLDLPHCGACCYNCALPLYGSNALLCGHCLTAPPPFDRCVAAFLFQFPVDRLILAYKYHRNFVAGQLLNKLLAHYIARRYRDEDYPDIITPVPLHWRRLLLRGFNQAALTARLLSRHLQLPLVPLCRRKRYTKPQQGSSRSDRLHNLRDSFVATQDIRGRHIAIVDDVITTGATAAAMAQVLKNAGAGQVDIWALARTPA